MTASPLSDFRDQCVVKQTNNHGALFFTGSTNEIPSNYQTDMLTVWRRLHVEVDSMAAVTNNFVSNNITGISGSATAATNLTLGINLNTGLTPADASPNLSTSTNLGRFENGTIVIGTGAGATTNGVTGNGNDFVRNAGGFSLPARIIYGGATNSVGAVVALSGGVFTITSNLGTNKYTGGTFRTVGVDFSITTNNATNITVSGTAQIPFWLHDDDDDTQLPQTPPIAAEFIGLYRPAYIFPTVDGGGDVNYNKTNVTFRANVLPGDLGTVFTSANALESDGNRADDFWIAYIMSAFQSSTAPDAGWDAAHPRSDRDPDSEIALRGVQSGGNALLFIEEFQDTGTGGSEERTAAHEIGHELGLGHSHGGLMTDVDTPGVPFAPPDIDILRNRIHSPAR